jgi:hypothetical protein
MVSRYVYERTRGRLGRLTDREYLWEPAPDCTTIRPDPRTGTYGAELAVLRDLYWSAAHR